MKNSIQNRMQLVLGIALVIVVFMGIVTLFFFSEINRNIRQVIDNDLNYERSAQNLKASFFMVRQAERDYFFLLRDPENNDMEVSVQEKVQKRLEKFKGLMSDLEVKKYPYAYEDHVQDLGNFTRQYEDVLQAVFDSRLQQKEFPLEAMAAKLVSIREEMGSCLDALLKVGLNNFSRHQLTMERILSNANRNLVFLLTLTVVAGLFILFLAPQKVARPIRVYLNAMRELRNLKFETRLPVLENNELTELGREINAFVDAYVQFDEMKIKKVQFEKRKAQVLADILNLGVIFISIEGEILFMNAQMAKFLKITSEDFADKDYHLVRLPAELKELFDDVLSKKEKFENRMIFLTYEKTDEAGRVTELAAELLVDAGMVRNYIGHVANIIVTFEDISGTPQDSIFKRISFSQPVKI